MKMVRYLHTHLLASVTLLEPMTRVGWIEDDVCFRGMVMPLADTPPGPGPNVYNILCDWPWFGIPQVAHASSQMMRVL